MLGHDLCGCENVKCDHGGWDDWSPCSRKPDPDMRIAYLGAVCAECYLRYSPCYRLGPRKERTASDDR